MSTSYPFSARYAYHPNGTVYVADFYSKGTPASAQRYRYMFGSSSYDALNRLRSADYSYRSGSSWASTAAYDLANITYDRSGNLKTAPASYSIAAATCNHNNLPLSLTSDPPRDCRRLVRLGARRGQVPYWR